MLTPLAVDPAHPFPYISNLSLNLAVAVRHPATGEQRFARVKVPPLLPRFVALPGRTRFVPLEQVIAAHLDTLFPGMEILEHYPFRVTRDADFELTDDAEDLLAAMESVLRQRTKFGVAVRLEVDPQHDRRRARPARAASSSSAPRTSTSSTARSISAGLWDLYALRRPELKYESFTPQTPPALAGDEPDVLWAMRHGDVMVHHPYDSFSTTIEAFVDQAARDPAVLAIKQTIYRTGGDEAGIVASLVKAAEAGKQVVALVELKARFDEQANIERARMLEQAGAHVVYGLVGLKTHAKILLVVRQDSDGIRRYCHVGTGNYNPKTATTYEDIGVLSSDPELGSDLSELFNHLTGYSLRRRLRPAHRRARAPPPDVAGADPRPGASGRPHHDEDELDRRREMIDELYAASAAGARIDLVVRGICCLRPGVPGLSERHHRPVDRRPLPRALADLPVRSAGRRRHRVRHRIGRHHAAQPRQARRGDAAGHRTAPAGPPRRDPRAQPRRRRARVDPRTRRHVAQGPDRRRARLARAVPGARCRARGSHRDMTELGDAATVADVIKVALGSSVERLFEHEAAVRSGEDPEDVHQARVAARRMRSDLRTFRDFVDTQWANDLRAELRWLGGELGEVRDIEVMLERLRADAAQLPDTERDAERPRRSAA